MSADAPRRPRRWHRVAIPFGLVLALIGGTALVHELAEPSRSDTSYLSPSSTAAISGGPLADALRHRNVTVNRVTQTSDALRAIWAAPQTTTLFIPAPEFVHPDYFQMLLASQPGTRVVLVEPNRSVLSIAVPDVRIEDTRWATAVIGREGACPLTDAGPAAVTRTRYIRLNADPRSASCYDGGLVAVPSKGVDFVLVGSADPFRADRFYEHDNAELATDLLSLRGTVVWLDLHSAEPPAGTLDQPGGGIPVIPSWGTGGDFPTEGQPPPAEDLPGQAAGSPGSPFPPVVFATIFALLLAGLLLALARGRRLGPPVPEPLPVRVRGAETALGRARLYRRAKARGPALESMRFTIRGRFLRELGLPTSASRNALLNALADRTGEDPAGLAAILYGPAPETDAELHAQATALVRLADRVTNVRTTVNNPSTKENAGD
jgi:hypothetical protein